MMRLGLGLGLPPAAIASNPLTTRSARLLHSSSLTHAALSRVVRSEGKPDKPEGEATTTRRANLSGKRKERVKLPGGAHSGAFPISDFLSHPSGVETLLNARALQSFQPIDSNIYRCVLHKIQFLKFELAPVLDLRVVQTSEDCTVEMLSCRFEGSEEVEQQNSHFSAFMTNYITWEVDGSELFLDVDVNLQITLEVYTKPFSLLPLSAVEKPGNLLMQGLVDRLVPLLADQLLKNYCAWIEEQSQFCSS